MKGERLRRALSATADEWADLGRAIRTDDPYAAHVTEAQKDAELADMLRRAEEIRQGVVTSYTIAQRLNTQLTGVCVPLFK